MCKISSNGGLVLIGNMQNSLAWQIGQLIPDSRKKEFIHHTYMEMVSQRIGQILCGYEDANDCNQLRGDSHFASHEFIDWAHDKWYLRYLTGLSGNSVLLSMVDKPRRRAENDYRKAQKAENERCETLTRLGFRSVRHDRIVVRRYYKLEYKSFNGNEHTTRLYPCWSRQEIILGPDGQRGRAQRLGRETLPVQEC